MKAVEKAVLAELRELPDRVASSALAAAAVDLARRLDAGPADVVAVKLTHELRLTVGELARRAGGAVDEVEAFLARVSTTAFGEPGD